MRIIKLLGLGFCLSLLIIGYVTAQQTEGTQDSAKRDLLYTCNCGPGCKCNTVKTQPGNCACNSPLQTGRVIKMEGNEAILCQCKQGCNNCTLDPNDPTKCSCGNTVKRVNLQGTGIYFCNCGGSCLCNTVSSEPGVCRCGMNLKKVD